MARFVKGDVVVVLFPFSDLTQAKRRLTSQSVRDRYAVELDNPDFEVGSLRQKSNIRPNRLFTADSHIILYRVGHLKVVKVSAVIAKVVEILQP